MIAISISLFFAILSTCVFLMGLLRTWVECLDNIINHANENKKVSFSFIYALIAAFWWAVFVFNYPS